MTATASVPTTWRELADAQGLLHDELSRLLDRPTTWELERFLANARRYVRTERATLDAAGDQSGRAVADVDAQHSELSDRLNAVMWELPGTAALWAKLFALRRALVADIELVQAVLAAEVGAQGSVVDLPVRAS